MGSDKLADQHVSSFHLRSFFLDWSIPLIGLLAFAYLSVERDLHTIDHPWNIGYQYCDSSKRINDPVLKNELREKGAAILREQLKLHPYHARVWGMIGSYFIQEKDWDSCIYAEKNTLKLGSGAMVNSVEPMALHDLGVALSQKLRPYYKSKDTALQIIQSIEIEGYDNIMLKKFRGIVYSYAGDYELAKNLLEKYLARFPNDFDALWSMSFNFVNHGMKQDAIQYLTRAQKVDPSNPNLPVLIKFISQ